VRRSTSSRSMRPEMATAPCGHTVTSSSDTSAKGVADSLCPPPGTLYSGGQVSVSELFRSFASAIHFVESAVARNWTRVPVGTRR